MKMLDEFRDPNLAMKLVESIQALAKRRWTIMEVCGGQTHGLLRHGIDEELKDVVELLHGPGCPVCVTPSIAIDHAIKLASQPGFLLATFGDMLRVPGSSISLLHSQAQGANVQMVYSPLDAVKLAQERPGTQVVFLAVGFETTAPATALAVLQADALGLDNFSVLSAHVRVEPAMEAIVKAADCRVNGFLAAGHVCTITGYRSYQVFARRYRTPIVVTGFEPVDLLDGIHRCVQLLEADSPQVVNAYARIATCEGNPNALELLERVFDVGDRAWRGLGLMPNGGLQLKSKYVGYDAVARFGLSNRCEAHAEECQSGAVMSGKILPPQCPHFGSRCTPASPLGAPMVSTEGACSAYYRYTGLGARSHERREIVI
ncbi:MAG: hydrogenase formation protein HypD [Planctomycetaceae bacterium]|nr:hydrogenase formation protein HypD [Planctomycetaceae bacterium]